MPNPSPELNPRFKSTIENTYKDNWPSYRLTLWRKGSLNFIHSILVAAGFELYKGYGWLYKGTNAELKQALIDFYEGLEARLTTEDKANGCTHKLVAEIHENVQAGKTKRLAAKDEATGYTHDMVAEVLENVLVEQGKRRAESRVKSVAV